MPSTQERAERIAAARRKLQRAMGRLVVAQAAHDATSEEGASGSRGDGQPEAGAGEEVGADKEGRGTSAGQSRPAGQFSANQATTASYFRTVKVLPSASRSKKRPYPAAILPTVESFK